MVAESLLDLLYRAFIEVHAEGFPDEAFHVCAGFIAEHYQPKAAQFLFTLRPFLEVFGSAFRVASVVVFIPVDCQDMPPEDLQMASGVCLAAPTELADRAATP